VRLKRHDKFPPLEVVLRAAGQCAWLALLAGFRCALLRLPIPVLTWLVERYRFDWLEQLQCDPDKCLFVYWGRYALSQVDPLITGAYLVEAIHRDTGRSYFAVRYVREVSTGRVLHIAAGYALKPSFALVKADYLSGALFCFQTTKSNSKKLYKKFAKR
jgi:hypothetical protein